MIKIRHTRHSFLIVLGISLFFHSIILIFFKKIDIIPPIIFPPSSPIKIDKIYLLRPDEIDKIRRVGIKNGIKKDSFQPDLIKIPKPSRLAAPIKSPATPPILSLESLGADFSKQPMRTKKNIFDKINKPIPLEKNSSSHHIYFLKKNGDKNQEISKDNDTERDGLKAEAFKHISTLTPNPISEKMSNFEIRYERPEGVSEDELNSDEKAYYSFFKRSYSNFLTKLYSVYEKMSIEKPSILKDFNNKHLLIGRIDYDENGNIILIKILKSSESDNIHSFFEETLKQLTLPNPPKSFVKNKKIFSTYYQIQIN